MIPSSRMFVSFFSCSCAPGSFASLPRNKWISSFSFYSFQLLSHLALTQRLQILERTAHAGVSLPLLSLWIWNSDLGSKKLPLYLCRGSTARNLCSQKSCPSWEFLRLPPPTSLLSTESYRIGFFVLGIFFFLSQLFDVLHHWTHPAFSWHAWTYWVKQWMSCCFHNESWVWSSVVTLSSVPAHPDEVLLRSSLIILKGSELPKYASIFICWPETVQSQIKVNFSLFISLVLLY